MNKKIIIITFILIFVILIVVFTRIDYAGIGTKIAGESAAKILNKLLELTK